ncbi:hypothetical protein ACFFUB_02160 [Algimonas porphyrae]|uniref:Uncharacterized protein n=1 Tax=Algimonas porphyrae TaxID=1128113 RepID=A0ABQ5V1D8_9PROT|nr:hypothetical protein [Algimonas porphyrae]GLQ20845.1 hypothetical protein GCM10007854_18000 [Algimonas porphyrae]
MANLRTFLPWLFMLLSAFAIHSATVAQSSAPLQGNAGHIDKIQFRGGYLDNSAEQPGRWLEKKNDGTINYEFFETGFNGSVIELQGAEQKVRLRVDLNAKTVLGEWPGHPMAKIYTVTDVELYEAMAVPAPAPAPAPVPVPPAPPTEVVIGHPPLAGQPAPVPEPQPVPAPIPSPIPAPIPAPQPPVSSAPSPQALKYAKHATGAFERVSDRAWREITADGPAYHFTVAGSDTESLFLIDPLRDVLIELRPADALVRASVAGEPLREVFTLTGFEREPVSPPVVEGTLSPAERARCADRGGFVERAGLLGAERCTIRYSDGGQSCTDSSQCEGQCRADVSVPNGAAATGVCQKTDNPFGCFSEVSQGQAGPGLCVD